MTHSKQLASIVTHNRILVIGPPSVGKSGLISRYWNAEVQRNHQEEQCITGVHQFQEQINSDPQIATDNKAVLKTSKSLIDNHDCDLDIVESSSVIPSNFDAGDGFLLVFSLQDRKSLSTISSIHEKILKSTQNDPNIPMVLVGNNQLMENDNSNSITKQIDAEAVQLSSEWNIPYIRISASASDDEKLRQAFDLLLDRIYAFKREHLRRQFYWSMKKPRHSIKLRSTNNNEENSHSNCLVS